MMTSNHILGNIPHAAETLLKGGLVAFPTETVYGLGADATNDVAVAKIYEAKGRPSFNPLISHVASAAEAFALGQFSPMARKLAQRFWPGPLTIVVTRTTDCPVSRLASAGLPSIALRVPAHDVALQFLNAVKRPVVAPSANPSGSISPTLAQHVRDTLGNRVDHILEGGACVVGVESTVVSFVDPAPRLLRPGGITKEEIESVLSQHLASPTQRSALHSPGQLESHYAPRAALRLNADAPLTGETYIGFGRHAHGAYSLSRTGNLVEAAANLFRLLHEIDATGVPSIAVAPIANQGLGVAINDRLKRAAAPRPS